MLLSNIWYVKKPTKVSLLRPKSTNEALLYKVGIFILCNQDTMEPQTT